MSKQFGELVKAKLIERKWSQRYLAERVGCGPTYITYLIRGINPSAASGKLQPGIRMVKAIAQVLGIPADETFEAAGYDPTIVLSPEFADHGQAYTQEPKAAVAKTADDRPIFDIAYQAALEAVNARQRTEPAHGPQTSPKQIKIEIPGRMQIVLLDVGDDLTKEEIERYRQAFLTTYESLGQQNAEARTK